MSFEDELRGALVREAAPADFKRKLMARIEAEARTAPVPIAWWRRRRVSLAIAAGLVVSVAIPGGVMEHRRRERLRGIAARDKLLTALSVTNTTLRHTRQMIRKTARRAG